MFFDIIVFVKDVLFLNLTVNIIGAGLAGSEAAYQLAKRGIKVNLYESKFIKKNSAQNLDSLAELVCSNSLRSNDIKNAAGLMKEELRRLDSLLIRIADKYQVPAGSALAVDREKFSQEVTDFLMNCDNINIFKEEVTEIPEGYTIIPGNTEYLSGMDGNVIQVIILNVTDSEVIIDANHHLAGKNLTFEITLERIERTQ